MLRLSNFDTTELLIINQVSESYLQVIQVSLTLYVCAYIWKHVTKKIFKKHENMSVQIKY
mgnify:CR=1 FL=1